VVSRISQPSTPLKILQHFKRFAFMLRQKFLDESLKHLAKGCLNKPGLEKMGSWREKTNLIGATISFGTGRDPTLWENSIALSHPF